MRREIRKYLAANRRIESLDLSSSTAEVATLLEMTERRHGRDVSVPSLIDFLTRQAIGMKNDGEVTACYVGDTMISFCLTYDYGDSLWGRAAGNNRAFANSYEYFYVTYYRQISRAFELGKRALQFGPGSLRAKALRGATISPLWSMATPSMSGFNPDIARRHNMFALDETSKELEGLESSMDLSDAVQFS